MINCSVCHRKSQLHLCTDCSNQLREMLTGLAVGFPLDNGKRSRPWLQCLEDAALGDTRLGESARRSTDRTTPLPFGETASQILTNTHTRLATWFQTINVKNGVHT